MHADKVFRAHGLGELLATFLATFVGHPGGSPAGVPSYRGAEFSRAGARMLCNGSVPEVERIARFGH